MSHEPFPLGGMDKLNLFGMGWWEFLDLDLSHVMSFVFWAKQSLQSVLLGSTDVAQNTCCRKGDRTEWSEVLDVSLNLFFFFFWL